MSPVLGYTQVQPINIINCQIQNGWYRTLGKISERSLIVFQRTTYRSQDYSHITKWCMYMLHSNVLHTASASSLCQGCGCYFVWTEVTATGFIFACDTCFNENHHELDTTKYIMYMYTNCIIAKHIPSHCGCIYDFAMSTHFLLLTFTYKYDLQ